jgi:hypothetical protein
MGDDSRERVDFVKSELAKTSIPEEYQVARVLAGAGFQTSQGRSYLSPNGTPREIDVMGEVPPEPIPDETENRLHVWLVAEAKHTDAHPWAVMDSGGKHSTFDIATSALASTAVRSAFRSGEAVGEAVNVPDRPQFFQQTGVIGHSLVVVGGKQDDAYDAMSQVVSAAIGLTSTPYEAELAVIRAAARTTPEPPAWRYAWPVLVISGELFVVDYQVGSANVVPTDWGRIIWHGGPAGRATVVDVVRLGGLENYAARAFGALRGLRQRLYFKARP